MKIVAATVQVIKRSAPIPGIKASGTPITPMIFARNTFLIPLVELVFENDVLGMVRQWQRLFYGKRFSQTNIERGTDLMKLADAFGVEGIRITKKSEIKPMLEKALKCGKPCLVDVIINKDINVLPMVPAGADVSQPIMNIELD